MPFFKKNINVWNKIPQAGQILIVILRKQSEMHKKHLCIQMFIIEFIIILKIQDSLEIVQFNVVSLVKNYTVIKSFF